MSEPKKCNINSIKKILDFANIFGSLFLIITINYNNNFKKIISNLFISNSFLYLFGR